MIPHLDPATALVALAIMAPNAAIIALLMWRDRRRWRAGAKAGRRV